MFISTCLAFTEIDAELNQCNETFIIALKAQGDGDIHLTVSYSQAKLLAEGLTTLINQAPVNELVETKYGNILGGMRVKVSLANNIINAEKGEEKLCQQPDLFAQMEAVSLSEIA